MYKLIIIIFLAFSQNTIAQSVHFVGEKIEILISEKNASVTGDYYFRNNSSIPAKRKLFYPFVNSKDFAYPDTIHVTSENNNISYGIKNNGINFVIEIPYDTTVQYQVYYWQNTPDFKMEYILQTTKYWKRPLEFAEYIIKVPIALELKYISYDVSKRIITKEFKIYNIHKKNFMPYKNLIIKWERNVP